MTAPLTEQQRAAVKQASEAVGMTAGAIAAGVPGAYRSSREEVYEAAYGQVKDHLAAVLVVIGELLDSTRDDAYIAGQVRGVLALFDWEHDDRQLALEAIERIVGGEA